MEHRNSNARCHTPHTTHIWSWTWPRRYSGYSIHRPLWVIHPNAKSRWCLLFTCVILKHYTTVVPCWWWCKTVHMPIMTYAVLSGSHSVSLVPDPHSSVLESRDIEILATHVSHRYFVSVYIFHFIKVLSTSRLLLVLGLTVKYLYIWMLASIQMYFCPFKYFITINFCIVYTYYSI